MMIFLVILVVLALWLAFGYNRLVTLVNRTKEAWADIDVQLKLVTDRELTSFFSSQLREPDDMIYLFGMVINAGPDSALVTLDVHSPNNPNIQARGISVGWVPPKGSIPVYFLKFLAQPMLRTKIARDYLDRIGRVF